MTSALYISYDGACDPLGQAQVLPYLEGLSAKGLNFSLLTFEKGLARNKSLSEAVALRLEKKNIAWIRLAYHKRPPVLSTFFDVICGLAFGAAVIRRSKVRVIHARSYVAALIALILKKIFRLKFIFDMRGFWAEERVEGRIWKRKGLLYWTVKRLEKVFLANADEVVVLTQAAKKVLEDWGYPFEKISVIPCCTDTANFKPAVNSQKESLRGLYNLSGKFIFVHTGSLEYWYMKEAMLDYFKVAKAMIPQAHFLFLTQYNKDALTALIAEKGLDIRDFTFLAAPFAEMPKMLSLADAGLIFITPVFSKTASCPTKFAEYLSCGLPVVINSKIGDLEGCVVKNRVGAVVRAFNHDEYKRSLEELLSLAKDQDLPARCRQTACFEFDLAIGVESYAAIYQRQS